MPSDTTVSEREKGRVLAEFLDGKEASRQATALYPNPYWIMCVEEKIRDDGLADKYVHQLYVVLGVQYSSNPTEVTRAVAFASLADRKEAAWRTVRGVTR